VPGGRRTSGESITARRGSFVLEVSQKGEDGLTFTFQGPKKSLGKSREKPTKLESPARRGALRTERAPGRLRRQEEAHMFRGSSNCAESS